MEPMKVKLFFNLYNLKCVIEFNLPHLMFNNIKLNYKSRQNLNPGITKENKCLRIPLNWKIAD